MSDRPLIFISHASTDKPRIRHITDYLLAQGFALFIDHPEKMKPPYVRAYCEANDISGLWSGSENDWAPALERAIHECDAVLAILSDALDTLRIECVAEIVMANALYKLVPAKIGRFDSSKLPGFVRGGDAQDVAAELDGVTLAASLDILVQDRIRPAIEMGRRARRGELDTSDRFRKLHELLPLCVGRKPQRRAIIDAADQAAQGRIQPVVVVGPENELPVEFLEALSYFGDGDESGAAFAIEYVDLPDEYARDMEAEFAANLAEELCRNHRAPLSTVAGEIAARGHPVIVHSRFDRAGEPIDAMLLEAWLSFWDKFNAAFPRTLVVPALSIILGPAKPGWRQCPPRVEEDADAYQRNLSFWQRLEAMLPPLGAPTDPVKFLLPRPTAPIPRAEATKWADDIRQEMLGRRSRQQLRTLVTDQIYGDHDARTWGVDHKSFKNRIAEWFEGV
jgi:hypothetical protein